MRNWSQTNPQAMPNLQQQKIWKLEQLINFGLNGERLSASQLKLHWEELDIDPLKKNYLSSLLWTSSNSQPINTNS